MKTRATWSINGRFLTQPQTGVQRYAGEMTREMDAWLGQDEDLARKLAFEICLPADCATDPAFANIAVRKSARGRGHGWEQLVLPTMAKGGLLSFANLGPIAHGLQILCLHDANTFLTPASYTRGFRLAYRAAFPLLACRAQAVTTVSAFSADMLQKFGVTGAKPARVIHNGHEHALRWDRAASRFDAPGHFKRPFVFALGSRAKHKQLDLPARHRPRARRARPRFGRLRRHLVDLHRGRADADGQRLPRWFRVRRRSRRAVRAGGLLRVPVAHGRVRDPTGRGDGARRADRLVGLREHARSLWRRRALCIRR